MLVFEQLAARVQEPLPWPCYDRWLSHEGEETVLFLRTDTGVLLRFIGLADFALNFETKHATCTPEPGVPDETLSDLQFNQVIPLVMGHDGELVLHASAVRVGEGVIAFLGATGRGKSTLAAAMARAGCPFLTDDGLILDETGGNYMVRPRRPILRLRPDSEAAILDLTETDFLDSDQVKSRVSARASIPFCDEALPLKALYLLPEPHPRDEPEIVPLPPSAALPALMGHSFILDVEDRTRVRAHFDRVAYLARRADCFTLDFPRTYETLPSTVEAIIKHAKTRALLSEAKRREY